ncbi:cytochrome b [Endozoicomonas sp. Mp262]|uniref:cytochrome b n=1 Tax=Endozoicomonas sp. Mp262 TaxID=2919499 RepID=UPI0021DA4027
MDNQKYHITMRLIHWLMALMLLSLITSGWYMTHLEDSVNYKYDIYHWHKSFGVLVLFLLVARIFFRWVYKVPPIPHSLPHHEKKLAKITHWVLYLFMFLVPASGYLMSGAAPNRKVPFFGLTMPDIVDKNRELADILHSVHIWIPYIFLGIITLHVIGALKHRYFDKPENDVFRRIL